MNDNVTVDDTNGIEGRIDAYIYETDELRASTDDDWDDLTNEEKLAVARDAEPSRTEVSYNVTTDRLHQYFVDNLDETQSNAEDNVSASWMALGTDSASGTNTSDTDLNTREYSEAITDHIDNGKELVASTFVDSSSGNGHTYNEIGLFTGDPANLANADVFMINHATFSDVTKDNSKTVVFDVSLQFSDV